MARWRLQGKRRRRAFVAKSFPCKVCGTGADSAEELLAHHLEAHPPRRTVFRQTDTPMWVRLRGNDVDAE